MEPIKIEELIELADILTDEAFYHDCDGEDQSYEMAHELLTKLETYAKEQEEKMMGKAEMQEIEKLDEIASELYSKISEHDCFDHDKKKILELSLDLCNKIETYAKGLENQND